MKGKMVSFGTDLKAKNQVSEIAGLCTSKPALIVLGNEEHGISKDVRENCDELVIIPFAGMGKNMAASVESLNVAQAASVILYEWAACLR